MSTIHNPTNFEPSDYEVEDYLDNRPPEYCGGPVAGFDATREMWAADMARALGDDWRRKSHRCIHCGNGTVRYITVCLHRPTGERVVFGADCTARLGFEDRHAFKLAQIKARAEAGHARLKLWRQRCAFLAAHQGLEALIEHAKTAPEHARNTFAQDVIAKLDRFGSLSVRQVEALTASLARDVERAAQAQAEAAIPRGKAPEGRQTVTGTILAFKTVDGAYGDVEKMLLELTPSRAKVWLSRPGAMTAARGDTVTVTATFAPSRDDPSFAFGKRPHLVRDAQPAPLLG